jgi:hypothetical protein
VGGISAAVSKTAAAPIERVKLLIQNQVSSFCHCCHRAAFVELHMQAAYATVAHHILFSY